MSRLVQADTPAQITTLYNGGGQGISQCTKHQPLKMMDYSFRGPYWMLSCPLKTIGRSDSGQDHQNWIMNIKKNVALPEKTQYLL